MSFYVDIFKDETCETFLGYIGYSNDCKTLTLTDDIYRVFKFETCSQFQFILDKNFSMYKNSFMHFNWDGNGENPEQCTVDSDVTAKEIIPMDKKTRKQKYKKFKEEVKKNIRKRLDDLPQYVTWDVCNTVRCKRNVFVSVIYRNGKKTSTSSATVYEAMLKVVENHMANKMMTAKQAIEYLATYNPKMEKGFTVNKALNRSKANKEALGIIC